MVAAVVAAKSIESAYIVWVASGRVQSAYAAEYTVYGCDGTVPLSFYRAPKIRNV